MVRMKLAKNIKRRKNKILLMVLRKCLIMLIKYWEMLSKIMGLKYVMQLKIYKMLWHGMHQKIKLQF